MIGEKAVNAMMLAKEFHEDMISLRRNIHMYPEIGFEVHRTAKLVSQELAKYGLDVKTNIGKTGVVADLNIPGAKKRIALRADMDALPMQEEGDLPYKSCIPMQAHLCGHDAHTAMLLGAARILSSIRDRLDKNVRFIFQPCEEMWPPGAQAMIEDHVLDEVDEIYALHVWPTLDVGQYGICVGPAMAQADGFEISIEGKGGHAASPHVAVDPIIIGSQIIQSLQTIVSQNIDSNDSAVLTVTQIHAGSNFSALPDTCTISGTVRTYDQNTQQLICRRMRETVSGIASAHGATSFLNYLEGSPPVYNHDAESKKAKKAAVALVGENCVNYPAQKVMFGEDFSYYTNEMKGCFIQLGCCNVSKGLTHLLHEPRFNIDEDCLVYGAALHVELALFDRL